MTELKTDTFTTSPAAYLRCLLGMWFKRYGLWVVLPLATAAAAGTVTWDVRWIIVALMMLFMLVPMLMAYLYFYYMLAPEARRAVLPMRVEVKADGTLIIRYADAALAPETLPRAVTGLKKWHGYVAIMLNGPRLAFILVPESALA